MGIKGTREDLRISPVDTLVRWQEQCLLWLLMAVAMDALIILAHSFFQIYLYMAPCEQCIYTCYAMFVTITGGLVAAINPKSIILKLIGCVMAFYGSILGLKFLLELNNIHHIVHNLDPGSLFGVQDCSTDPTFPFNLLLVQWAPNWSKLTGDCSYDAPIVPDGVTLSNTQQWFVEIYQQSEGWYLLSPWHFMNMAQAYMLAFGTCPVLLVVMGGVWMLKAIRDQLSNIRSQSFWLRVPLLTYLYRQHT